MNSKLIVFLLLLVGSLPGKAQHDDSSSVLCEVSVQGQQQGVYMHSTSFSGENATHLVGVYDHVNSWRFQGEVVKPILPNTLSPS